MQHLPDADAFPAGWLTTLPVSAVTSTQRHPDRASASAESGLAHGAPGLDLPQAAVTGITWVKDTMDAASASTLHHICLLGADMSTCCNLKSVCCGRATAFRARIGNTDNA